MVSVLENSLLGRQKAVNEIKQDPNVFNLANNETERFVIGITGRLTILSRTIEILIDNKMITIPSDFEEINCFKSQYIKEINIWNMCKY